MPALVKNTLDWISRPTDAGGSGVALFQDKVAGIVSASPGPLGGLRSLLVLRDALAKLGLLVVPQQVAVGQAADKLPDYGVLNDDRLRTGVHNVGAAVVRHLRRRLSTRLRTPHGVRHERQQRELNLRFLAEPTDVNYGGKVHGGMVMKWIDQAGYAAAVGWAARTASPSPWAASASSRRSAFPTWSPCTPSWSTPAPPACISPST